MATVNRFFKRATTLFAAIVLIIAFIVLSVHLILTPKSLNSIVETVSKEYIDGEVKADAIKLNIFKHFPYLTLSIQNGCIVSTALDKLKADQTQVVPAEADTLLRFKYLNISLSLPQLLGSNINVRRISLVSPEIYAYTAPDGCSNFNILKFDSDTTQKLQDEDGQAMQITVNRINIREGAKVVYNSRPDSLFAEMALERANIRGTFSTELSKLRFNKADIAGFSIKSHKEATVNDTLHRARGEFNLDSLEINNMHNGIFTIAAASRTDLKMNNSTIISKFPIEIDGKILFDTTQSLGGRLDNLTLSVAKIPILFNGNFSYSQEGITTNNLCGKVNGMKITDLLKYLPSNMVQWGNGIKSNATLNIDVDVNGTYNFTTGDLPSIYASLTIPQSSVEFEGRKSRINRLEADIRGYYSATNQDSAAIEINKLTVNGRGILLGAKGKIGDIVSDNPLIQMELTADAYLDTLCTLFPSTGGSEFEGTINADLALNSRLSDLNIYRLGNAGIKGNVKTERTKVIMPKGGIYAILSGIDIVAGSSRNTTDASIKKGMKMLATNSTADSIYIRLKDGLMVAARGMRIAGHHSAEGLDGDTTQKKVLPLNGIIEAARLDIRGADSLSLAMANPNIKVSVLPYKGDNTIPAMSIEAKASSMRARGIENRYGIRNGGFSINAILDNKEYKEQRARFERRLDSLQKVYPEIARDSLPKHLRAMRAGNGSKNDFAADDIDIRVDRSLGDIIRQWNISGKISARSGRIVTPYFPMRTRMENMDIGFTTDKIEFNNTRIKSGENVIDLCGKLEGLKRALLGRGKLNFNGQIVADTLNFNQLLNAVNAGMGYMSSSQAYKDSLSQNSNEDDVESILEKSQDTVNQSLIVIPGNLNAQVSLFVKHGIYSKITLNRINGELQIRDRCLKISDFEATTDAGSMNMSAFYATRSKKDISTGFDLELKDIFVEKFIEATPAIDTLLPMLRSLEGRINCQFAATSQLDTAMNFIPATLKGVARLTGDSLVLLDGETFATIAKKLKFKNKKRNLIDHVGVEMIINESKIEIFPFMMQMDRYKFAMSGTQHLDLSFDYHISVLQSPIPFRLGVTVFGNMDDFDFKIGKARYKSAELPVYTALIDSTRLNLRDHIANIYKIGIDAAMQENRMLKRIEQERERNEAEIPQQMEALTQEEQQKLEETDLSTKNYN